MDEAKLARSAARRVGAKIDVYDKKELISLCRQHGLSITGDKGEMVARLQENVKTVPTISLPIIKQAVIEEGKTQPQVSHEKLVERALSLPAGTFLNLDTKHPNKNLNRRKHPLYSPEYNFASKSKVLYEACLDAAADLMHRYRISIIEHYYQTQAGMRGCYLNLDTSKLIAPAEAKIMQHEDTYRFATNNERLFKLITTEEDHMGVIAGETTQQAEGVSERKTRNVSCGVRFRVWRKYNGDSMNATCYCCNEPLRLEEFEAGHVVAKIRSQNNDIANLRPICRLCNRSMGSTHMKAFAVREGMEGRIIKE